MVSSCVLHVPVLKKKGIKIKASVFVYTFKDNKTVDRNKEFISEIIGSLV